MRWMRMLFCGAILCCEAPGTSAQEQPPSLGEAARRQREHKKQAPKPKRVWTNDDLPSPSEASPSVVGPPATEEIKPASTPRAGAETKADEGKDKERKDTEAALGEAKEQLERAQKELDIAQREYSLDRQQYYSSPQYTSDKQGKAKLDAIAAEINAKQHDVEQAKDKIARLQEKLNELKSSATATKPEAGQPPQP